MREEREKTSDQEEENPQKDMFIIIFATVGNLHHLGRAETWYGDGTFSVCPSLFYQLYTIHAEIHGLTVPLVSTCCLPNPKDIISLCCYNLEI